MISLPSMPSMTLLCCLLLSSWATSADLSLAEQASLNANQAKRFSEAQSAFRSRQYAAAYGRFALLANEGHAASARIALLMVEQGADLFGTSWSASVPEQLRWRALTVNQARAQQGAVETLRGE